MITNISHRQRLRQGPDDESKKCYTEVLGFEEKDDITLGDGLPLVHGRAPRASPRLQVNLAVPGPAAGARDGRGDPAARRTRAACTGSA